MFDNVKQALSADVAKIKADATADARKVEGFLSRMFRATKRAVALHLQAAVGLGASIAAVLEPHFSDIQAQLTGTHVLYFIIGSSIVGWLATASHVKEAQDKLAQVAAENEAAATTIVNAQPVLDALSQAHANLVAQATAAIANVAPAAVSALAATPDSTPVQATAPTDTSTPAAQ
ncbi:hypothetical protein [Burkholderia pseudomallei]|uniref:hypothetical protein n=1 Tax=Burkholderia pseudomallei TaxID=28450 RepID=UPI0009783800|nr:hypothetical protein [Burkholderia pseudomallei]OMS07595.1 hypothetical protein AQ736_03465 [Burkholderia pseudomallei]OMS96412.1 hypothetical protein AQ750_04565 [Burkholderia pseudomallei]OMV28858.1 hypothetical protein AQ787_11820 [Burkholderia pseudomallei]CAJ3487767.1 Uncharacterised protein [Burkholderia pseudomallei]CAJ4177914.1 Uncharacterised protein [Burkholderia pseudomallei]